MKKNIFILVVSFFIFSCEEKSVSSLDVDNPQPSNLEDTLGDNSLSDTGTYDDYFYDFNENINVKFLKYEYQHLFLGAVFKPEEDTINFTTYPDFFVTVSPDSLQASIDADDLTQITESSTSQEVVSREFNFEINGPESTIDSLKWQQVSGDDYRYVVYSTKLKLLPEIELQTGPAISQVFANDYYTNNFQKSIFSEDDIASNYMLIDTVEWDTTVTYSYTNSALIDTIFQERLDSINQLVDTDFPYFSDGSMVPYYTDSTGLIQVPDVEDKSGLSYEFVVDTMVVIGTDLLFSSYVNEEGETVLGEKMDNLLTSYRSEYFTDLNNNGVYDPDPEPYSDLNNNQQYDVGEVFVDIGNGVWDDGEEYEDVANGSWDAGEEFIDVGNCQYDDGEDYVDIGNCQYDDGEDFTDVGNGVWDDDEPFTDLGNGVWNDGEIFIDSDGNGSWSPTETFDDLNGNGICDYVNTYSSDEFADCDAAIDNLITQGIPSFLICTNAVTLGDSPVSVVCPEYCNTVETFDDVNGNGVWDLAETFTDVGNGYWNEGESFSDLNFNGQYDLAEDFIDIGNGVYDDCEEFVDSGVLNGVWDPGEDFTDIGNGQWDEGEQFVDRANGVWDQGEDYDDTPNGQYDSCEEYTDVLNGQYDSCEDFTDVPNGQYDVGEVFVDIGDGVWNFTDLNNNQICDQNVVVEADDESACDTYGGDWSSGTCTVASECEDFTDLGNGQYDVGEVYTDSNNNGIYDEGEVFEDLGNLIYDQPDTFTDQNNNGVWDDGEPFIDYDGDMEYDSFIPMELLTIYPGDILFDENGDIVDTILVQIPDYKYYKTSSFTNIESAEEVVTNHVIFESQFDDVSDYNLAKTQSGSVYDYHLFNRDSEGINQYTFPSYFNYVGLWNIQESEEADPTMYDFFGPEGSYGFWFEEEGIRESLFYLQGGEYFRDGEHVQTFEVDTTEHAIYYISKDYQVERDTVSVEMYNGIWDAGYCVGNEGLPSNELQQSCIDNGFYWIDDEKYNDCSAECGDDGLVCEYIVLDANNDGVIDADEWEENPNYNNQGNGIWDEGEELRDKPHFFFKDECFKITRVMNMEMKGTGVTYNEMNITWLAKDYSIVKDEVFYSWGDEDWIPYSRMMMSEFRSNSGSQIVSNGEPLRNFLSNSKKVKLNDLDKRSETDFNPYKKFRSVGIQKIGTSY